MARLCIAGFVVTSVAVTAATVLLIPEAPQSSFFILRLLWECVLAGLLWGSVYAYFSSALQHCPTPPGTAGVTPALVLLTFGYALLSLTLMVLQACFSSYETLARIHLALQIFLLAAALIVALLMRVSLAGLISNSQTSSRSFNHDGSNRP